MQIIPPELRDKEPDTITWPDLQCPKCGVEKFGVHGEVQSGQLMYVCQACTYSQVVAVSEKTVIVTDEEDKAFAKAFTEYLDGHNKLLGDMHLEDPVIQGIVQVVFKKSISEYDDRQKEGISVEIFKTKLSERLAFMETAVEAFNEALSAGTKFTKTYLRSYQQKKKEQQ